MHNTLYVHAAAVSNCLIATTSSHVVGQGHALFCDVAQTSTSNDGAMHTAHDQSSGYPQQAQIYGAHACMATSGIETLTLASLVPRSNQLS